MQEKQETIFEDSGFLKNEHELNQLQSSAVYLPHRKIQLLKENIKKLTDAINYYDDADLQIRILAKLGEYNETLSEVLGSIDNATQKDKDDQLKYRELAKQYNPKIVNKLELEQQESDRLLAVSLYEEALVGDELEQKRRGRSQHLFFTSSNHEPTPETGDELLSRNTIK
ncbi:hypothetical protein [Legionella sp. WA2022007384]